MAARTPSRARKASSGTARRAARTGSRSGPAASRPRVVWAAFLGAMTLGAGALWALDTSTMPRLDGLALPPLMAAAGPSSVEVIFNTRQPLEHQRWQGIVIHHSGAAYGTPESIDQAHRERNLKGLGYHFVIGNGNGIDDGELHVGYRWMQQVAGAHAAGPKGDQYNRSTIGICLVGNGNREPFTEAQMRRLTQVVEALCRELNIPPERVELHSDVAQVSDPGRFFPRAAFLERLGALR